MKQLEVRIGKCPKSRNNPEGLLILDAETREDVTNQCAFINFIPRRGYIWRMFLLNAGGLKYMDPYTREAATEWGRVVRVKGRLRHWIRTLLRPFSRQKGGEVA